MKKQQFVKVLHAILGRGDATVEDTSIFSGLLHDELIRRFIHYLNSHRHFLGYCRIEECHALNDRGVDVILRGESVKVGFQLKSHFDAKEAAFAANVKRQMTESFAHALDLYVILVCCPIRDGSHNLSHKVSHLLNELSALHTPYHIAIGPRNAVQFFRGLPVLSRDDLLEQKVIDDDCLHYYEKGYEHLPEPGGEAIREAAAHLNKFGSDWWDTEDGNAAYKQLQDLQYQRSAEQFLTDFLPTIPDEVRRRRTDLVKLAQELLADCRACKSWDDRSEYKLSPWLGHVPEPMIPYTSLPNLLSITVQLRQYLEIHRQEDLK